MPTTMSTAIQTSFFQNSWLSFLFWAFLLSCLLSCHALRDDDPPIFICHMNRTVTVDISSPELKWQYAEVTNKNPAKPLEGTAATCRSGEEAKSGFSFNIDAECNALITENSTHRKYSFTVLAKFRRLVEDVQDTPFPYECVDPLKYSGPDRLFKPIFTDGRYVIDEDKRLSLSSRATTTLIIVVAVALFLLVSLIAGIVCVTCDCFGKGRFRHKGRMRRNRKPRDPSTRY